jgi:hypothetical protein
MRLYWTAVAVVAATMATPAFAGISPTPAPVAGVGVGAVILVGLGYRALRRPIDR